LGLTIERGIKLSYKAAKPGNSGVRVLSLLRAFGRIGNEGNDASELPTSIGWLIKGGGGKPLENSKKPRLGGGDRDAGMGHLRLKQSGGGKKN